MPLIKEDFIKYDNENPQVWEKFKYFTLQAIRSGRNNMGSKAIMERIRWYTMVETSSKDVFKINNNYSAFYARKFMKKHPRFDGFFRTRGSVAD
jgi:hypothetical protein